MLRPASAADKPNVIVIMADDQGSFDLGAYGATDLATPHTDALATRGVRLTQFYSAAPPEEITMAEMFKAGGYATAHIGKWHIGYTPETRPLAQGFDLSFGHNLAERHPDQVRRLRELHEKHLD